jgi:hypothetical protein
MVLPGAYASASLRTAFALKKVTLIVGIDMTIVRSYVDIREILTL